MSDVGEIPLRLVFGQGFVSAAGKGLGKVGGKDFGVEILADGFGGANPELRTEKVLRTTEDTTHWATASGLDNLACVIKFFV